MRATDVGPEIRDLTGQRIAALDAPTLCHAFQATAAERPGQVAHRTPGGAIEITYAQFADTIRSLATGFHSLGLRAGDTVALMLRNRPEFALADAAAMHLGAVAFSVYNTSSPGQIAYVCSNAGNRVIVTELAMLPRVLQARMSGVEHIVLVDGTAEGAMTLAELAARPSHGFRFDDAWRDVQPEDVVTLIYTSGTTGPPKAVQLTHANVMFEARAVARALPTRLGGRGISYLPSAHVGDRVLVHYSASMCLGTTITDVADYRQIAAVLPEVRPTSFGAVPRVWEKMKGALEAAGIASPAELPEAFRAAVRARIGLDQADVNVSSAAPASPDVLRFFAELGLVLNEGWGMSEVSCLATVNPPDDVRPGTVGRALPGVELRLLDDGELLVRGPLVMKGYRNDPERTAEAIDRDGWLHTGDVARIDGDGYVTIVDRKKEIIINSAGKNMSPANIEYRLRAASPLIAFAVCIGDRRPYNTALLVLDPDASRRWASQHGLPGEIADLHRHPDLRQALQAAVDSANAGLSRVEQIKRFAVIDADWQPGGDELTPTSKLRRRPIGEKYADVIEAMYR